MPCSFFLYFCFYFFIYFKGNLCALQDGAQVGNIVMAHVTQICWFNKTCSSGRTSKWPGAGGGRINECRIYRSSWNFTGLKIIGQMIFMASLSAYLSPPCSEAKVMKWSHTACSLVNGIISYGWFTLWRAAGAGSFSERVCSTTPEA